ncbi:ribonuclease H [Euzebya sp.]|uniref:ribonuclease H family protein n=1 Tax=Euzebya sp. TaxID=1971409 RepID=UPI0035118249
MSGTCATCGRTFEVAADLAARYPGWTPKECPSCFRSGAGGGGGGSRRRTTLVEENLTTAEVLERYSAGPADGVFTDGSAQPNPGPGGWGAVYVVDGEIVDQRHGHDPDTTNNRMELTAIASAVELVPVGTPATIWTDSKLAVDTLTSWAHGWARRGWRRKGGEIKNLDLIKPLHAALADRPELRLEWIAAHSGNRWNEYADSLSTAYLRDTV